MAQIIKHRRGNLEGLSSATTRAGELLVVTGSSGLGTIANGASLVFVGIDGSTATPVNKILQGTTVPDLTGADYNTHVDGIPFYDTDDNKLYILNKGGNIEVKASPETGGTGIISGSSQVDGTGITNNSITISGTSVSLGGSITDETLFGGVGVVSGSSQVIDILGSLNSYTASNDTTNTNQDTRIDQLATETGSIATEQSVQDSRLSNIESATGSYLTTVDISDDTNLAVSDTSTIDMVLSGDTLSANVIGGVHSGSAQVVSSLSNQATDFGTGRVSADNIGNVAGDTTFTGSFSGDGSNLTGVASTLDISGSTGNGTVALKTQDLTITGTSNEIETSVSGQTVTIGLPDNVTVGNNLTVGGNLTVEGTTTTVDSTTVTIGDRILELNYARGAGDAGLLVTDVDGTTASGSLIWDSATDAWYGGALSSEKELARLNASPTSNTVLKANSDGLLVDSLITDDGTNVTISGTAELRINAATANSFVYFDSNKSLESVAASTSGDVIQWNGSSFVASNEIDGGTF